MGRLKKLKKIRIHHEGTHILIGALIILLGVNAALYYGFECKIPFYLVAALSITIYLLMVNFFRCPIRLFGQETEKIVVAPADGKIVAIEEVYESEYFKDNRIMVSIFMSILNVHANWYPVDGTVKMVGHQNGKFMKAWLPKALQISALSSSVRSITPCCAAISKATALISSILSSIGPSRVQFR